MWYDFFCVPNTQTATYTGTYAGEVEPLASDFLNAIASIPGYIERCTYFFVLAPPVLSLEEPKMVLDYESWKKRGWCRAERASRALGAVGSTQMLLVEDDRSIRTLPALPTHV